MKERLFTLIKIQVLTTNTATNTTSLNKTCEMNMKGIIRQKLIVCDTLCNKNSR